MAAVVPGRATKNWLSDMEEPSGVVACGLTGHQQLAEDFVQTVLDQLTCKNTRQRRCPA
ncbi:MAG TPA: hypothetical protein VFC00_00815 [Micromonosporaceae bacterium]|nr:hypothetical protein [Micromonosporaceae bacterium]